MSFEDFIQSVININPYSIVKIFVIVGMLMYVVFAFVVVRQEDLMSQVLEGHGQQGLRIIALIHLIAVILLFLMALLIL